MSELDTITQEIRTRVASKPPFGNTAKFDFKGEGFIYVDGKGGSNEVSNEDKPADCTLKISLEDFKKMARGELDGTTAFMAGKLQVDNIGVAMKIGGLLA